MRNLSGSRNLNALILAATAGSLLLLAGAVPSVPAQTTGKGSTHNSGSTTKSTHSSASSSKKTTGKSSTKKKSKKVKGQTAPTPDRISEIQEALAKKGALDGSPSGKWDDSTTDAVRKFQSSNGLNPSGKLDALTLQKLGLGSETAGLAKPTPPPNSVNRLRNTTSVPAEPQEPDSDPPN